MKPIRKAVSWVAIVKQFSGALRAVGCIALGGFLLLMNNQAWADDLFPPSWRSQPRTTLAEWDFTTAANPTPPDGTLTTVVGDSGGMPMAEMESDLVWDAVFGGSWGPSGPGIPINNLIFLEIPNWIDQEPVKFVQIQLTYQPGVDSPHVIDMGQIGVNDVSNKLSDSEMQIDPLDNLWHRTELWTIRPNPDSELIAIDVPRDSRVAQIVVDTISIPEPSCMALALLSLLATTRILRRR